MAQQAKLSQKPGVGLALMTSTDPFVVTTHLLCVIYQTIYTVSEFMQIASIHACMHRKIRILYNVPNVMYMFTLFLISMHNGILSASSEGRVWSKEKTSNHMVKLMIIHTPPYSTSNVKHNQPHQVTTATSAIVVSLQSKDDL